MPDVIDPRLAIQTSLRQASNYNGWMPGLLLDRELIVAVDEWPEFVEAAGASFSDQPNVVVHQADLADPRLPKQVYDHGIDSVICSNVLEHVEDRLQALSNFATIVGPGGRVFLLVLAFMTFYGEHDRADHHFRRYTKRSLRETVAPLPLEIEQRYYMNLPGFFAWFTYVRLMRRRLSEQGIGLYDRVIPAIRAVESRRRPPFGQTLVAVMRSTVPAR